jgi:hypothetical protein
MTLRVCGLLAASCLLAPAAVRTAYVSERTDVLEGRPFGSAGPYERIVATAYFSVDPNAPQSSLITDIKHAPRNENGLVEFSADVFVLKPRDSAKGNGTVLFEVSNRGNKGLLGAFNHARTSLDPKSEEELGDGFLLNQGFTLVWVGWQFDVPEKPGLLRLYTPAAKGLKGTVRAEFVPAEPATSFLVSDRSHIPYPAVNPGDRSLHLTVRDRPDGPRRVVPRDQWSFSDPTHVSLPAGFQPGKFYEVVYHAQDPPLVGLGPTAVRDFISYLKYGGGDAPAALGDQHMYIKRAMGFGTSQSGRFLRTFLYHGFNSDEQGRKVFDGVWANVAGGGRGSFNHRFAQPSRDGHRMLNSFYPTDLFPFSDLGQTDPETGQTAGLLDRAVRSGVVPRIFYTNSSYEYWGRSASLTHTSADGRADAPLPPGTRVYHISGAQHGPGSFPPSRKNTQQFANTNNFRYVMRALLVAMNDWLTSGAEPPASAYPRIDKGQLCTPAELRFPRVPGIRLPFAPHQAWRVDYGPEFVSHGIVSFDPPKVGKVFPILVPQVNQDGNEESGIRMPEVQVPLATLTGWNLRSPEIGAPDELSDMTGSWLPFPLTASERQGKGDPRLSISERYKSKEEFSERILAAARDLVRGRFLLEQDVAAVVKRSEEQWDYVIAKMK